MSRILVTGATGRLGRLVVERLLDKGQSVRILTRRPEAAFAQFGGSVEIAAGAFSDRTSLDAAFDGVEKLFLLSPISETLASEQIAVVDAAVGAGVSRIVKLSGSDWTIDPPGASISGEAHAAVEWHLRGLSVEHVSLRPNAWMQVGLAATIQQALSGNLLQARHGEAAVSYIDARDIADVAVHQLLAPKVAEKPLILTGGEALTVRHVASLLAQHLRRPVGINDARSLPQPVLGQGFEHRAVAQFMSLIAEGHASATTETVASLLGRAPRSVADFIAEHFAAEAALSGKIA
jgi:uncharacterized protein YbjT (DUF2867 family)